MPCVSISPFNHIEISKRLSYITFGDIHYFPSMVCDSDLVALAGTWDENRTGRLLLKAAMARGFFIIFV